MSPPALSARRNSPPNRAVLSPRRRARLRSRPANPVPDALAELARAAECCGYDSVWAPEVRATDPFGLLAWIGARTTTIRSSWCAMRGRCIARAGVVANRASGRSELR
ncbi:MULTISPECIES: LLM class flavin-dependent oxidoreductase [Amycolatopsis]|uniref:LLM class flavin-dependent oxidoreductase n=1 Tax=Amycolatopsis albidoflavus TaxID=102226 RepID=A0ABW5HYA5_9PSEU